MHCDTTDQDLLKRVRSCEDQDAWGHFVEFYRLPIVKHCRSCGLTSEQSDEVAQDCFIRCFRYLPTFDYDKAVGRFRSWLNLMVNQQIGEHFRSRVRDETVKQHFKEMLLEMARPSQAASQEPAAHDYELLSMALQRVKTTVRPQHWQMFEAFVLQDQSASQVALQLGVSSVMVRVSVFRVRNRVRDEWKALQNGPF
jgi:RNA polymerase sigma-70 factor (ECF subfamily)